MLATSVELPSTSAGVSGADLRAAADSAAVDLDMRSLLCLDDFEEYRARAFSGGSLYGVLRRQAFLRGLPSVSGAQGGADPQRGVRRLPPPMNRQRSKSLIQRGVALSEDKCILKMLCDYSESARKQMMRDNYRRRQSESALLYNRSQRNSSVGLQRSRSSRRARTGSRKSSTPCDSNSRKNSSISTTGAEQPDPSDGAASFSGPTLPLPPGGLGPNDFGRLSLGPPGVGGIGAGGSIAAGRSVCRRRSFSLTQNGIVNDGDELITLPTTTNTPRPSIVPDSFAIDSSGCVQLSVVCPPLATTAQRSRSNSVYTREVVSGGTPGTCRRLSSAMIYGGGEDDDYAGAFAHSAGCDDGVIPVHRVLMLGGPGVGKTALTQQFVTSEYMAAQNTSFDDGIEIPIPVLLDGEESVIEFVDLPYNGELNTWSEYDVDGYIIVYSITDRRSYQKAVDVLFSIRGGGGGASGVGGGGGGGGMEGYQSSRAALPIILVANKSDLERSRIISKEEGRTIAETYDSKYIDVSAILNHKVDDLLVGILKQIRLSKEMQLRRNRQKKKRQHSRDDSGELGGCFPKSKHSLLSKLVVRTRSARRHSRSCENLLRL